ncbi:MAG TPA: MFS transporter [Verrucomicrobiae bacterium]|nr:MFS transporter [Verrucomicrobiae bacterium]
MSSSNSASHRLISWKWIVCGLLLLASAINYMDRQTLANAAVRISNEFNLSQTQYGNIEAVFGYAFAAGSLVFGFLADRMSLRWLYAAVLALWSVAGIVTGFVRDYDELLICRFLLGFFEAGHWPCAIRTTRMLLDESERSLGNGLLQSGASMGAIITPLIMSVLMTADPATWRTPFFVVGTVGMLWLIPWFLLLRGRNLKPVPETSGSGAPLKPVNFLKLIFSRRMLIVFFVIALINTTWQIFRAWMPKFLQEGRGYTETHALYFNSAWFVATDIGCLGAGALAVWLAKKYLPVHTSRVLVFAGCALLTSACVFVPWLGKGWLLLGMLSLAGAGALGVFPLYHAFTQDISGEHQGKITGIAGVAAWLVPAQIQRLFGMLADHTGSFDLGLSLAGLLPLLAVIPLWLFWNKPRSSAP